MIHVIDTETTGMDPESAEVIELACVDVETGDAWDALIQPAGPIPPTASAVHHLTAGDFTVAFPTLKDAWRAMQITMGDPVVYAAHNAEFDMKFCKPSLGKLWLCTWRCAMHLFPDAPAYGNQVLRYYLGLRPHIPDGMAPHRALYDTLCTAELLRVMLTMRPIEELLELQHQPVILKTCAFGKHRGQPWSEVPKDYLAWIIRQGEFDRDTLATAKFWIAGGR